MERFTRVLAYFRPYMPWLILGGVCMVLMSQTDALLALFVKPMFDEIFLYKSVGFLWVIPIFGLALMIFKGVFGYIYGLLQGYANAKVTVGIRNDMYERYLGASLNYFDNNPSGELMSKLQVDAFNMQDSVNVIMQMFQLSITFLGLIGVVFYRDWRMALLGLTLVPLVAFPVVYLGRLIRKLSGMSMESMADLNVQMHETLAGIRIVKAFGLERTRLAGFLKVNERYFGIGMRSTSVGLLTQPVIETIITIGVAVVLMYGGFQVIQGRITPGVLFSFLTAIGLIYDPVRGLSRANNSLQASMASADRVFDTLDTIPRTPEKPDAKPLNSFTKDIVLKDVSFHYQGKGDEANAVVLCNVNMRVEKGRTVALVGSSGAGKTTFVNLIPRFYDITDGAIEIDGIDIRDMTLRSLRDQISVVTQETYLFNDTIRNNIAYGIRKKVNDEQIEKVAKAAYAHEFIMGFPEGYDTMVGERGARLSGGQRQRIAIARALLKNAPILILDEATSSLDSEAEQTVQKAIEALMADRTTIVIAHRLSTVRNADLTVVLEEGRIIETGKHEELLSRSGVYKKLYELQFAVEDRALLGRPSNNISREL